ncbi:Calcium-dependent protein kinase 4 [Mortierella sp. GBA30]|nr:Calcium-dependent protein kinase 4 [Mortierella sp. GBA30]
MSTITTRQRTVTGQPTEHHPHSSKQSPHQHLLHPDPQSLSEIKSSSRPYIENDQGQHLKPPESLDHALKRKVSGSNLFRMARQASDTAFRTVRLNRKAPENNTNGARKVEISEFSDGVYDQNPKVYLYQQQQHLQLQKQYQHRPHSDDTIPQDWETNNRLLHSPSFPPLEYLEPPTGLHKLDLKRNASLPDMKNGFVKDYREPTTVRATSPVNLLLPGQATNRSRSRQRVQPHHFIGGASSSSHEAMSVLPVASEMLRKKDSCGIIPQDLLKSMDPKDVQKAVNASVIASRVYKVLSPDQLETLKKEQEELQQFVEAMNVALHIESRMRDASHSLIRLHESTANMSAVKAATSQLNTTTRKMDQIVQRTQQAMWRLLAIQRLLCQHDGAVLNAGLRRLDGENRELSRNVMQLEAARGQEKEEKLKWKKEHNRLKVQSILLTITPSSDEKKTIVKVPSGSDDQQVQQKQQQLLQLKQGQAKLESMESYAKELNENIVQKDEELMELKGQLGFVRAWANDFQAVMQTRNKKLTKKDAEKQIMDSTATFQKDLSQLQSAVELELKEMDVHAQELSTKVEQLVEENATLISISKAGSPRRMRTISSDSDFTAITNSSGNSSSCAATCADANLSRMIQHEQKQDQRVRRSWLAKATHDGSDLRSVLRESLLELDQKIRTEMVSEDTCGSSFSSFSSLSNNSNNSSVEENIGLLPALRRSFSSSMRKSGGGGSVGANGGARLSRSSSMRSCASSTLGLRGRVLTRDFFMDDSAQLALMSLSSAEEDCVIDDAQKEIQRLNEMVGELEKIANQPMHPESSQFKVPTARSRPRASTAGSSAAAGPSTAGSSVAEADTADTASVTSTASDSNTAVEGVVFYKKPDFTASQFAPTQPTQLTDGLEGFELDETRIAFACMHGHGSTMSTDLTLDKREYVFGTSSDCDEPSQSSPGETKVRMEDVSTQGVLLNWKPMDRRPKDKKDLPLLKWGNTISAGGPDNELFRYIYRSIKHVVEDDIKGEVSTYSLESPVLGSGVFSDVYKAKDKHTDKVYACKVIDILKREFNKQERDSIVLEIELLKTLDHKNIIKFVDVCQNNYKTYIFTEYIDGTTLYGYYGEIHDYFSEVDARHIFAQVCEAVKYLHKNDIVHRDIKSENVMITHDDRRQVKLIDFDVWALGVMLFRMLTGSYPFHSDEDESNLEKSLKPKTQPEGPNVKPESTDQEEATDQNNQKGKGRSRPRVEYGVGKEPFYKKEWRSRVDQKSPRSPEDVDVYLGDNAITSNIHCLIDRRLDEGDVVVTDASKNGTYINSMKIETNKAAQLLCGDELGFIMPPDDPTIVDTPYLQRDRFSRALIYKVNIYGKEEVTEDERVKRRYMESGITSEVRGRIRKAPESSGNVWASLKPLNENTQEHKLSELEYSFGRGPSGENSIIIDNGYISRKHCTIEWVLAERKAYLKNLTTTGTHINDLRCEDRVQLRHNDKIYLVNYKAKKSGEEAICIGYTIEFADYFERKPKRQMTGKSVETGSSVAE